MSELINAQASSIERRLSRSLSATRILAQEVQQNGGLFEGFEAYAEEIIRSTEGISNLQLAPDGVIKLIHPLKGNERAIGHDILKDDRRKHEALMALQEQHMTLAGPFELIQGGVAVIGRNPVFLTDPATERKYFWGFASALIFLDDLLAVTDLDDLAEKGYAYELSRIHPDSQQEEVFARSEKTVQAHTIAVSIRVPNGEWKLRMSAPTPVSSLWYMGGYLLSVLVAAVIVLLLRKILIQPQLLQDIVNQQTRELQYQAYHDPLTGLPNRVQLKEAVVRILNEYARYKFAGALLMIDLDDFKQVNDLCGHDAGDQVLQVVAQRIQNCVRKTDMVARIGGDEFGVLIQHAESVREVNHAIQSILAVIHEPIVLDKQTFTVSASIGIAFVPQDGDDYMSVYKHADMAMYAAKDAGKNKFSFYNDTLQVHAVERIQIQNDFARAIARDELQLYLQPIVDLHSHQVNGYEALVRWHHPQRGLLAPGHFIPIIENSHCIIDLGYWVVAQACRLIREHQLTVNVSVNLSPKQFRATGLVSAPETILRQYDVNPQQLELEVTESCFIDDIEEAIATLHQLRGLGLSLSLDDFGTGYSSLSLLQRLPVQKLKIDRSFVRDLVSDERDKNIVQGLNMMAHKLNLTVVAEGIESPEQLHILQAMGCDLGQGFYFSKPAPFSQLRPIYARVANG